MLFADSLPEILRCMLQSQRLISLRSAEEPEIHFAANCPSLGYPLCGRLKSGVDWQVVAKFFQNLRDQCGLKSCILRGYDGH